MYYKIENNVEISVITFNFFIIFFKCIQQKSLERIHIFQDYYFLKSKLQKTGKVILFQKEAAVKLLS